MAQNFLLPGIEHDTQSSEYFCGPACINMVLSFWDKQQAQADLWEAIKVNTGTEKRPKDAPSDEGSFDTQHCDSCGPGHYHCWYTTPEAMEATINDSAPDTVRAEYLGSHDVIRRIADSLSATSPVPAAFTTFASLHWVVAVGYQLDGPGSSVLWNGQKVTALYVRDPGLSDPGADITQMVTMAGLVKPLTGLLMSVECGPNTGQYPVVSKGTPTWIRNYLIAIVTTWRSVSRLAFRPWPWKWWVKKPPRPPRPMPPL